MANTPWASVLASPNQRGALGALNIDEPKLLGFGELLALQRGAERPTTAEEAAALLDQHGVPLGDPAQTRKRLFSERTVRARAALRAEASIEHTGRGRPAHQRVVCGHGCAVCQRVRQRRARGAAETAEPNSERYAKPTLGCGFGAKNTTQPRQQRRGRGSGGGSRAGGWQREAHHTAPAEPGERGRAESARAARPR